MMLTVEQVFGNQLGSKQHGDTVKSCLICGALVNRQTLHVTWHNRTEGEK